jgi:hypothetical protein
VSAVTGTEIVERIWARDPTLWTGHDEAEWLGWLDEPIRLLEDLDILLSLAERAHYEQVVLLGMGGSSLAPEVLRRSFGADVFHVLDTTHPAAIRRLTDSLDLGRTLFVASSKSGGTIETRSHLEYFWERTGGVATRFAAVTDPGSSLEQLAHERDFVGVAYGEASIGGRYSALSPFGILPAILMGLDARRLLERAEEMREACRYGEGNPGLDLGLADSRLHPGQHRPNPVDVDVLDDLLLEPERLEQPLGLVAVPGVGRVVRLEQRRPPQLARVLADPDQAAGAPGRNASCQPGRSGTRRIHGIGSSAAQRRHRMALPFPGALE